jgi:uncharacterized SAM-binding protein YcdF (DUF218 family)
VCAVLALALLVTPFMGFAAVIGFCGAGALLVYGIVSLLCRHPRWGRRARGARWVLRGLAALWFCSFLAVEGLILHGAAGDPAEPADCVLVLGAGLNGETPSLALAIRLDVAADYLNRYPDTPVVVSGGQGSGESVSEAEAMARYLADRGIDGARIIQEARSTSTAENFAYSIPLMPPGTRRVAVVSNEFHLFRARILARRAGLVPVALSAVTPRWYLKPQYYVREYFSVLFMWLGLD